MRISAVLLALFSAIVAARLIAAESPADVNPPKPQTAFNALPRGTQSFDGVVFKIRAPINIIGARAAKAGGKEFARVTDTSVRGSGKYIHVLHTGDHGSSAGGNFIWRLVLRYADGESCRFDFAYGVHLRNFWRRPNDGEKTPNDPDSAMVWTGTSVESDRRGADLVVSRTTLLNPRPDKTVVGADYVSLLGPSSAYVFAVTVTNAGPRPVALEQPGAPHVPPLTFVFQDANGRAETNAVLNCSFECDGFSVRLAPARPDDQGKVSIDVPTEQVMVLRYEARDSSAKIQAGEIEVKPGDKGWRPHLVRFTE